MATFIRRRGLGRSTLRLICEGSDHLRFATLDQDEVPRDEVYIRWGCTGTIPHKGATILNRSTGIHLVADKTEFRRRLQADGAQLCPRTFFSLQEVLDSQRGGPFIVRTRTHAQGKGLYFCTNLNELRNALVQAGPDSYINEYIPKEREFRVFVLQGRALWVAEKHPQNRQAIAWNHQDGDTFENVRWDNWPRAALENALSAWARTGLHFAGIDIIQDRAGNAYCLEANSGPAFDSEYRAQCVARGLEWALDQHEFRIHPFTDVSRNDWKGWIHPGVWQSPNRNDTMVRPLD